MRNMTINATPETTLRPLELAFAPVTREQARDIVCWQYEPPYEAYTIVKDCSDTAEIDRTVDYFLRLDVHCHAITAADAGLIGFCTFGQDARVPGGDYSIDALDIGLGVRPDWTGHGYGTGIVTAVIAFAITTYKPHLLRVTIAEHNRRARRVWEKNGFEPQSHFNAIAWLRQPFVIFTRTAAQPTAASVPSATQPGGTT